MADLLVRNLDESVVAELKSRAGSKGISAEEEHRNILRQALRGLKKRSLAEVLAAIPDVGEDSDFVRVQDDSSQNVFD